MSDEQILGAHLSFEELPSEDQSLTFDTLESSLVEHIGVQKITPDILKTLELYTDTQGFNRAAALLADINSFPGVDLARFGSSNNVIKERLTFSGVSLLTQLEKATDIFEREYLQDEIQGSLRKSVARVPREAFREALANALIHRTWDVPAHIKISMFDDRLEIVSPGGLPTGVSADEYLHGYVSLLRNPILGTVFFRLGLIEKFDTGITRIRESYRDSVKKPEFFINPESICVRLPVIQKRPEVSPRAQEILSLIHNQQKVRRADIDQALGASASSTARALTELLEASLITRVGRGPSTYYTHPD